MPVFGKAVISGSPNSLFANFDALLIYTLKVSPKRIKNVCSTSLAVLRQILLGGKAQACVPRQLFPMERLFEEDLATFFAASAPSIVFLILGSRFFIFPNLMTRNFSFHNLTKYTVFHKN